MWSTSGAESETETERPNGWDEGGRDGGSIPLQRLGTLLPPLPPTVHPFPPHPPFVSSNSPPHRLLASSSSSSSSLLCLAFILSTAPLPCLDASHCWGALREAQRLVSFFRGSSHQHPPLSSPFLSVPHSTFERLIRCSPGPLLCSPPLRWPPPPFAGSAAPPCPGSPSPLCWELGLS